MSGRNSRKSYLDRGFAYLLKLGEREEKKIWWVGQLTWEESSS